MREYLLWLAKVVTMVAIILFFVPLMLVFLLTAVSAGGADSLETNRKLVAVLRVDGMITDSKPVIESLYKQAQDDKVKGIVLRIDSPGGAVGPSQEIYNAVRKLKAKKPIVASLGTVAASGGFYAALGASKIYCQPGTITGSVGVIMQIPNVRKLSDMVGVEMVTVKSGALKDVGNAFREMAPEEREFLQNTIGVVHEEFVQAIVESRGIDRDQVVQIADGRVLVGSQALKLNLVDGYGDIYDAAREVFELRGEPLGPDEMPKLIHPDEKFESLRKILESALNLPAISLRRFVFDYSMY
ncbi:MAG: signal peptide peptidase SppA [Deltaproteobacteria bacterium]|nr:signal peptide peptidase SppA [Deltaproteobacteria bacterium]